MHISEPPYTAKPLFSNRLYRESIWYLLIGRLKILGKRPFDDQVTALRSRPLGMFFYNQRAIFLISGGLYLAALGIYLLVANSSPAMDRAVWVLTLFWSFDVILTLVLHHSFLDRLSRWVSLPATQRQSPLFVRYFLIDSTLVFVLLVSGKYWSLPFEGFASLLFANTIVYSSAYLHGKGTKQVVLILLLQVAVIFILLFQSSPSGYEAPAFYVVLNMVPLLGMVLMTVLSLLIISDLRSGEYTIAQRRLGYLMRYEHILSQSEAKISGGSPDTEQPDHSEQQFRWQVTKVLESLCKLEYPFWYRSACLWFAEKHQDRIDVLIPGPRVNFPEADDLKDGIDDVDKVSYSENLVLLHSLKRHFESGATLLNFRRDLDAPAAFIPLHRNGRRVGILALYGEENGPPLLVEDESFLWFVGSIITNSMEQWEGRYQALPLKEMDDLFVCNSLDEVFPKAVRILKKYLEASGCMVIFRENPADLEMRVRAEDGLVRSIIRKIDYKVGVGQTGECAATRQPIRWDNVQNHLDVFDADGMTVLEKALHKKVVSWMAIPIGDKHQDNYGVIKVVNSTFRCSWFTEYDQTLGQDLARRLHIMIEKFLQINRIAEHARATEEAKEQAQENEREAHVARTQAEQLARQRQDDLTIITHQLQGPLSSVITAVTNIQRKLVDKELQDNRLKYVYALVEDALALCFGTFSTFGREAGRDTYFGDSDIDAPTALKDLAERLQRTNGRQNNLTFKYSVDPGFPTLRMDGRVFTSVFYSLIHNAMKYAAPYTHVTLECSFERATGRAALKVKSLGEPILPTEKELIFGKYKRGKVMQETGRYHSGVGLGLWVARELMRAVGGEITLELSSNDPELSVFVVHVPRSKR